MVDARFAGIGMTSARTRDRLVQRLREQGITNLAVLDRMRNVPRHIFVDEALGTRAYEDTAFLGSPFRHSRQIGRTCSLRHRAVLRLPAVPTPNECRA